MPAHEELQHRPLLHMYRKSIGYDVKSELTNGKTIHISNYMGTPYNIVKYTQIRFELEPST